MAQPAASSITDIRAKLLELDRRIHVDVFGGTLLTHAQMSKAAAKSMRTRGPGGYWFPEGFTATKDALTKEVTYKQEINNYSTDIDEAFKIVQHLRKDSFAFRLTQHDSDPVLPYSDRAICSFVCSSGPCEKHGNKQLNHHGAYDVEAQTIEQAICLAALRALGKA